MTNVEIRMTKQEYYTLTRYELRHSGFWSLWSFGFRDSGFFRHSVQPAYVSTSRRASLGLSSNSSTRHRPTDSERSCGNSPAPD